MNDGLIGWLAARLGRRLSWRLGRALYLEARGDAGRWLDFEASGEARLQRRMLEHAAAAPGQLVVFDVGANVGDWTLSLLDRAQPLGLAGRLEVHAFEPVPAAADTLRRRVAAHALGAAVRVVPEALSSVPGTLRMFIAGEREGTNSLHPDALKPGLPELEVRADTLDRYAAAHGLDRIQYVKVDAEGHDL